MTTEPTNITHKELGKFIYYTAILISGIAFYYNAQMKLHDEIGKLRTDIEVVKFRIGIVSSITIPYEKTDSDQAQYPKQPPFVAIKEDDNEDDK